MIKSKIFLILALSSLCYAQKFDPAKRIATGTFGHGKYTIGDTENKGVFEARTKMEFWGEGSIEFAMEGVSGVPATIGKAVALPWKGNSSMEWIEDGDSLRWKFKFATKPASNKYQMKLGGNWQDFGFHYQTPFTNPVKYTQDGEEWLLQHEIYPGDPAFDHRRPRKVDGSYAVYHKTKANFKYGTGKACHIYVPKARDAAGKTAWCGLHILNGIYTVTIPQAFLDNAAYPVTVNDTFGFTGTGGTQPGWSAGDIIGDKATPTGGNGTGNAIYLFTKSGQNDDFNCALYNNGDPGDKIANGQTDDVTSPTQNNFTAFPFTAAPNIVDSTEYYFGAWSDGAWNFAYDSVAGRGQYELTGYSYTAAGSGGMPDPLNWDSTNYGRKVSIYVDYTPSGGVDVGQVIIISN